MQQAPPAEPARAERLFFPVEGADRARLRASFDDQRGGRPHRGLDIFAPRHSPVRAVDAGVVARLSRSAAGGTAVEQVDGAGRYCYYYAHLDRYASGLREGQALERGQVIDYVGTSGNGAPALTPPALRGLPQ